jgi:hypothetical protein
MTKEHASRGKSGMGGGRKSSKSKGGRIHTTHIKHFKSGGHVVTHDHEGGEGDMPEPDENVLPDKASLMQHLQDTVPDNGPAQMAPPAQAGPPQAGPGPAGQQAGM